MCESTGTAEPNCKIDAVATGLIMLVALAVTGAIAFAMSRRSLSDRVVPTARRSLLTAFMIAVVALLVAHLIYDPLSVFDHAVLNPIAVTMNAIPVTPGGLGVTEGTFAYLARAAGSDNGALIALISRMVQYSIYLLGGLLSIFFLRWQGYRIPTAA